jgi:hypothetical protein
VLLVLLGGIGVRGRGCGGPRAQAPLLLLLLLLLLFPAGEFGSALGH